MSCFAISGFHKATYVNKFLPESSVLIIFGIIIGIFFFYVAPEDKRPTTLTPDIFFLFLLPPIIGEAGYFMPNRLFFDQLGTILLMAVVGTIFNMFTIGGFLYVVGLTGLFRTGGDEECRIYENMTSVYHQARISIDVVFIALQTGSFLFHLPLNPSN